MNSKYRLLTVDAAGTLIRPWPSVGSVYAQTAREYGLEVKDKEIDTRFYEIFGQAKEQKNYQGGRKRFLAICSLRNLPALRR